MQGIKITDDVVPAKVPFVHHPCPRDAGKSGAGLDSYCRPSSSLRADRCDCTRRKGVELRHVWRRLLGGRRSARWDPPRPVGCRQQGKHMCPWRACPWPSLSRQCRGSASAGARARGSASAGACVPLRPGPQQAYVSAAQPQQAYVPMAKPILTLERDALPDLV